MEKTKNVFQGIHISRKFHKKKKAGTDVWFAETCEHLQNKKIAPMVPDIFASYSGPDEGLTIVHKNTENGPSNNSTAKQKTILGAKNWSVKSRKAYAICMSLYDQNPVNGKISGDPIADAFGICARKNNALLVVADGVNWGEKSKMAARSAVYGCMKYMHEKVFCSGRNLKTTQEVLACLRRSFDCAHETILQQEAGLTTLCAAMVVPLKDKKQYAVCVVNVGDSFAFVQSNANGFREITIGSHDIDSVRDIRDAGGALGPVDGTNPELHNLTCSMTIVDPGDIVFLTTDGISDNFDPVVTKMAVPTKDDDSDEEESDSPSSPSSDSGIQASANNNPVDFKPAMTPQERHQFCVKGMERVLHEFELFAETPCCAQELCGAIVQHVTQLTDQKRKVLENPELYGKKLKSRQRKERDEKIVASMRQAPGKLDHATIVAYEVGNYHYDDENYDIESSEDEEEDGEEAASMSTSNNSNSSPSRSRPNSVLFESAL
ncbi:unnamed protein product [Owenia fusiformis]|uniref:PPM-type phosphatase domain-containing protein n=1 Tax=Owenia fusiformis TaxID=6347 RepID=A0A8S4N423_OWEFU|nr:unnamed protein product [Owenia fusiformis]